MKEIHIYKSRRFFKHFQRVSDIKQKAFIDVNEDGSKAAALTGKYIFFSLLN